MARRNATGKLAEILHPDQLGGAHERIWVLHWEDDEYVLVVDGNVSGQTLHYKEAVRIARWLSTALGAFKPLAIPVPGSGKGCAR